MTGTVLAVLVGFFAGGWVLYRVGKAVARAQRAYRDWRAAVESVRDLFKRTVDLGRKAAGGLLVAAGVVAALVAVLYAAVARHQ